ncbi:MAG TPA: hypothetical protein PLL09_03760 [Flavobacterium sp.]|uniref:hypothetical protein n=1 Tax=unclassified Flavobacterium TaxID=196869 RepID=UPI000E90F191|nr:MULTISPECIES: hypothetical protein [unclassified Flavobacterium]HBI01530.1 hypothetical protein [Flavobacterium sp.]HRE76921.1 hypothetical protein [Flavobacterium sp.]
MKSKLTFLFLLINYLSFSQSIETLKSDCAKMYDATYNMDFEKILDYTHPKVFDIVDKETMLTVLDETFQNDKLRIRLVHPKTTFTFSEVKEIDGKKICVVEYPQAMRMIFENPLSEEEKNALEESLKTTMTSKKITFEKDRNAFYIDGKDIMIAVSEEATQNKWKLINYDKSQPQLLNMVLGENVVKQLGLQ